MDILFELKKYNILPILLIIGVIAVAVIFFRLLFFLSFLLNKMNELFLERFLSSQTKKIYLQVVSPYQNRLKVVIPLILLDLFVLIIPKPNWLKYLEFLLGLSVAITIGWLSFRLFDKFFALYLVESAINRKVNGELLVVVNAIGNVLIGIIETEFRSQEPEFRMNSVRLVDSAALASTRASE